MLYTLTLYNIICQIYVNETVENSEEKKKMRGRRAATIYQNENTTVLLEIYSNV